MYVFNVGNLITTLFGVLCLSCPPVVLAGDMVSSERVLIYQDDFDADLSQWVVEQAEGGSVEQHGGELVIDDAKGCTVWFKEKLKGAIVIEFEVTMVQAGGKNDRVSDLNCFWMAIDPKHPENLFGNKNRGGIFRNYDSLRLYYVGYGANKNTTTRFRRYPGDGTRPCLPEHDFKIGEFQNTPHEVVKVQITSDGETIEYKHGDIVVFQIKDEEPFTAGWFGLRTVRNHMRIDNFRVYALAKN
ncbi:DUF6250 domain-containing protein [Rubritalea sp.]|uniref:DUF6250 domain-containing protein n=1 Tax=Rubritalea sp. TaxID=2109375 RepID=UPI003EF890FE